MKTLRGRSYRGDSPKTYATIPAIRGFGDGGRPGQYLGQGLQGQIAVRHPSGRTSQDGARVFDDVTKAAQSATSKSAAIVANSASRDMDRFVMVPRWGTTPVVLFRCGCEGAIG